LRESFYREKRRTINAIGSPMQNMIVSSPMVVPTAVIGRRATNESGSTTKFMNV
jgi:hypothetical protein